MKHGIYCILQRCRIWLVAIVCGALAAHGPRLRACELCAIYSASSARGESSHGLSFTVAEQFTSQGTLQAEGEPFALVPFLRDAHLDSFYTHFVPGYNFSSRFGVSLNMPVIYRQFRRVQLITRPTGTELVDESGSLSGLGDIALIGRWTVRQKSEMKYSLLVNLLGGVKLPTGDTDRLRDEVAEAQLHAQAFPNIPEHAAIGGIHQHDLTLGSGSIDGVFGVATTARWRRWFINNQVQYYLRTRGESYRFGDQFIVSGGPGVYALLKDSLTLSLQANAFY